MAETKIEWADYTFNSWIGCTKVSPACDNCYAENWGHRFGVKWGHNEARRKTSPANWQKPRQWNMRGICTNCGYAELLGSDDCRKCSEFPFVPRRPRIFCASLADVFDTEVPDGWRLELMDLIKQTPNLDWLLLTKRPKVMAQWARDYVWPVNAWAGTTVENQAMADLRIPELLKVPAPVRFLSMEPLLGPVDLTSLPSASGIGRYLDALSPRVPGADIPHVLDWVIVGGESGPNARPMHPDWARSLRDQCEAAGVPFFFKQWGEWEVATDENERRNGYRWNADDAERSRWVSPAGRAYNGPAANSLSNIEIKTFAMYRVGKKAAGRLLDGREHNEFPNPHGDQ